MLRYTNWNKWSNILFCIDSVIDKQNETETIVNIGIFLSGNFALIIEKKIYFPLVALFACYFTPCLGGHFSYIIQLFAN